MKLIKTGHTNKVYKEENKIIIEKNNNKLNHRLKYETLKEFDFVPKLLKNSKETLEWEFIDGELLAKPTKEDLMQLGLMVRKTHKSEIKLPKNNLRERVRTYLKIIHDKYLNIPEIEQNWKTMNKLITHMNNINPVHNDIWWENILKDKNNKLWLIDWEYATMGDKHFDLAFYIESSELTKEQEEIFLKSYNSLDNYNAYIPEWMNKYKMFVNWLTLLWAYSQEELPFPLDKIKQRINDIKKVLNKK